MFNSIEERIQRLEMAAEAQRLIGLYSSRLSLKQFDKIPELFALDQPQVRAEMLWGVYENAEGIDRLYNGLYPSLSAKGQGRIEASLQAMEVPIIAPAKDGKTVKAVWVCPGYATIAEPSGQRNGYWSWQKYACDFIMTQRELKIWHLHVYGLFECKYMTNDVVASGSITVTDTIPPEYAPDREPTTKFDLSDTSIYPYAPAIPKPYTVFDQDYAY